ncbi:MAG: hypothetical protein RL204_1237 [Bacteroidota bacterium]|jgi:hypothetical protein
MHDLEPYYNWRGLYIASEDPYSPFYEREYSEFEFTDKIYNHYIHPQWDSFGSQTLFMKILFVDYEDGYAIMEFIGEWNDLLYNDIMLLKREIIEHLMQYGISKYILLGENVLNFHSSDDCYYEEWFEEVNDEDGWIAIVNLRDHVLEDFQSANIDSYFVLGGALNDTRWRTHSPDQFFQQIQSQVMKRLTAGSR